MHPTRSPFAALLGVMLAAPSLAATPGPVTVRLGTAVVLVSAYLQSLAGGH